MYAINSFLMYTINFIIYNTTMEHSNKGEAIKLGVKNDFFS